jgi:hypothetical protein
MVERGWMRRAREGEGVGKRVHAKKKEWRGGSSPEKKVWGREGKNQKNKESERKGGDGKNTRR